MIAVDTNVLLRYLIEPLDSRNPNWQVRAAKATIDKSDTVFISDIVLVELEWVLEAVFDFKREEILFVFQGLASNYRFQFEDWRAVQRAMLDYQDHRHVELSDCLLAHRATQEGAETLYTFESGKGLGGLENVTSLKKNIHL
jgi:predicted nucleic-acid-binding protein